MWRLIPTLLAITALAISFPATGVAQSEPLPGERIRILTQEGSSLTGTFVASSADAMVLVSSGDERHISYADVAYLERSTEHYRKFGMNFLTTVGIGAAIGGILMAATWSPCESTGFLSCLFVPESRGDAFAMGIVGGGALSAPIGVIVGLVRQYDLWEPISVPEFPTSTITIKPVFDSGLGLAASVSF